MINKWLVAKLAHLTCSSEEDVYNAMKEIERQERKMKYNN